MGRMQAPTAASPGTGPRSGSNLSRNNARLAGGIAAASTVVLLWAVSVVFDHAPFAPQALAERFLRATPGDLATFFIETLGHWARRLLTIGALVVTVAFGAEALARTRKAAGNAGAIRPYLTGIVLGSLAFAASLASPSISASVAQTFFGSFIAILFYAYVARSIYGGLVASDDPEEGRRQAIKVGLLATVGLTAGGAVVRFISGKLSGPNTDVDLVAPVRRVSATVDTDFPSIPGLSPEVTSASDHYIVDINLVQPSVDASGWSLGVGGEVDEPMSFTFQSLQESFDVVEEYVTLSCVSNEVGGDLVGNSAWGGVRLKDVLEAAGVRSGAMDVVFRAADGYSDSIPLELALDPSVLLAVSQNGEPLQQGHGFPCRVRIPAIYGMKNVKWLEEIEVVPTDFQGYWQKRGWSDDAAVKTQSRIDVAGDDGAASAGEETWVAGVAWAGDRKISKVEVSTDGGQSWAEAQLKQPLSDFSWRQWAFRWIPEASGAVEVMCRATDGAGETQTPDPVPPHPDGASGYHAVTVSVA